jgi:enoyl-CoA hydratase/carnithine racemase
MTRLHLTDHPDLIVERAGNGWTIIRLNRPKSLHALDESLARSIFEVVIALASDNETQAIWMDSSTPKAFCAGGDVRQLRQMSLDGNVNGADIFFREEYAADLMLHQYSKPIVVWGEGYVMGGGMGLMMAAPFRLVTPTSKLAMPEINIGLFPDVGATRFLAERGLIGLFLGLTGALVDAGDAHMLNWATHVSYLSKEDVLAKLVALNWTAQNSTTGHYHLVADALAVIHRPVVGEAFKNSLDEIYRVCRGMDFIEDYNAIISLSEITSNRWLKQAADNLKNGSPSTAALTWLLWQWANAANRPWAQVFALEIQLAEWKIRHPDFNEGVRARLVDKDNQPVWQVQQVESLAQALGGVPSGDDESWLGILQKFGVV